MRNNAEHGSNFHFLVTCAKDLADLGTKAERYQHDDPQTSILKVRQFAERLTKLALMELGIDCPSRATQSEQILLLQMRAPRDIVEILHEIRRSGNRAAHELIGGQQAAEHAIRLAWRLGVWYRSEVLGAGDFAPTPFQAADEAPVPPQSSEAEALRKEFASATPRLQDAARMLEDVLDLWSTPR